MSATALYAALLTPIFLVLSVRVIGTRRSVGTAIGDAGSPVLLRRMRVQANFAEYVPLALILMALAESLRTPAWLLHLLGVMLLVGRLLHAVGVSRADEQFSFRISGMALTLTAIAVAACACLASSVAS